MLDAIFARLKNALLVLTVLWVSTTLAMAASPSLGAVRPVGAQRGTEIEVTLSGARLGDAKEIFYYQPGITTVSLARVDDNTVKAKLKIAADAPLGLHDLRVHTTSGSSEVRTFSVGALKEVFEVEPNNDFAVPQAIPMNVTVTGVADNEDVDYYVVDARKGDRITAEVEGMRLGITLFDPYVAILNTKRFELASSDDAALIWQDGFASILAPEDGKYIIQVREGAYAGNTSCLYRLYVGNFPRPTGLLPAGGKLGEKLTVRWIGDPAGEATTEVTLPAASIPDFGLYRQDPKGASPYPNSFRLTTLPNVLEKEPNDDQVHATPFTIPMALNGVIDKPGDVDQYVFTGKKGQTNDFRLFGRQIRSSLDSVMFLGKKGAGAAVGNDDSTGPDSYFRFTCPEDAEYVVWVLDHLRKGGPDYVYRIEVTPVEIVEPKVPLVRGGSMGLKVRANRKPGFKSAISIYLPWNPPGVGSAGGTAIPEGQNEAFIPMNADGGAELRTWKIVVNGASGVASGPIMVSSQLANLTIATLFLGLTFGAASVEQGKETDMAIKVAKNADFPGEAQVTLVGLPNKVTSDQAPGPARKAATRKQTTKSGRRSQMNA